MSLVIQHEGKIVFEDIGMTHNPILYSQLSPCNRDGYVESVDTAGLEQQHLKGFMISHQHRNESKEWALILRTSISVQMFLRALFFHVVRCLESLFGHLESDSVVFL